MGKVNETQTDARNEDCFRVYQETIDELRQAYPKDIMQTLTVSAIVRRAMEKRPMRFYMSEKHFTKCIRDHESTMKKKKK